MSEWWENQEDDELDSDARVIETPPVANQQNVDRFLAEVGLSTSVSSDQESVKRAQEERDIPIMGPADLDLLNQTLRATSKDTPGYEQLRAALIQSERPDLMSDEEIAAVNDPPWYKTLTGWFEPLYVPSDLVARLSLETKRMLPNTDTWVGGRLQEGWASYNNALNAYDSGLLPDNPMNAPGFDELDFTEQARLMREYTSIINYDRNVSNIGFSYFPNVHRWMDRATSYGKVLRHTPLAPRQLDIDEDDMPFFFYDREQREDPFSEAGQVARKQMYRDLYKVYAEGDILQRGKERLEAGEGTKFGWGVPFVDIPGLPKQIRDYRGVDVYDAMMPISEAARLAEQSKTSTERAYWERWADPVWRARKGMWFDIFTDPLWLVGNAGGSRIVKLGGEVYNVEKAAVKGVGAVERGLRAGGRGTATTHSDLLRGVVQLEHGTAKEAATVRSLFASAKANLLAVAKKYTKNADDIAEAVRDERAFNRLVQEAAEEATLRRNIAKETLETFTSHGSRDLIRATEKAALEAERRHRLIGGKLGKSWLRGEHKRYVTRARVARAGVDKIDELVSGARTHSQAGREWWRLRWHAPFDRNTNIVIPKGLTSGVVNNPAVVAIRQPIARRAGRAADMFSDSSLAKIIEKSKNGDPLLTSERFIMAMRGVADPLGRLSSKGKTMLMFGYEMLGNAVGRSLIQPAVHVLRRGDLKKLGELYPSLEHSIRYGGDFALFDRVITRVQKVSPELWDAYSQSVRRYMVQLAKLDSEVTRDVDRIMKIAQNDVLKLRKVRATELDTVKSRIKEVEKSLEDMPSGPGRVALQEELSLLERDRALYAEWASPDYGPVDVVLEAMDAAERGLGVLNPKSPFFDPALGQLAGPIKAMVDKYSALLGKSKEEVAQTLVAIERFARGDAELFRQLVTDIWGTREELAGHLRFYRGMMRQASEAVQHEHAQRVALLSVFKKLKTEDLAYVLEKIRAENLGLAYEEAHRVWILNVLTDTVGDPTLAKEIYREIGLALNRQDAGLALRELAQVVSSRSPLAFRAKEEAAFLKGVDDLLQGIAPPKRGGASVDDWTKLAEAERGEITADVIRKFLAELEHDAERLARMTDGTIVWLNVAPEVQNSMFHQFAAKMAERYMNRSRAIVGEDGWDEFLRLRQGKTIFDADVPSGSPLHMAWVYMDRAEELAALNRVEDAASGWKKAKSVADGADVRPADKRGFKVSPYKEAGAKKSTTVSNDGSSAKLTIDEAFDSSAYGGENLSGERVAVISGLKTDPKMRRQGYATDLLESAMDEARKRGATRVIVYAEKGKLEGPGGVTIFRNLGFKTTGATNRFDDKLMELELRFPPPSKVGYEKEREAAYQLLSREKAESAATVRKAAEDLDVSKVGRKGAFSRRSSIFYRLRAATLEARSEEETIALAREALKRLAPDMDTPLTAKWFDATAREYGKQIWHSNPNNPKSASLGPLQNELLSDLQALTKRVEKALGEEVPLPPLPAPLGAPSIKGKKLTETETRKLAEARTEMDVVPIRASVVETNAKLRELKKSREDLVPRIQTDLADENSWRLLEQWEKDLWRDFRALTSELTPEDKLRAAFTALSDAPKLPAQLDEYAKLDEGLPALLGTRMGELEPELEGVVVELRRLVDRYEDLYAENGLEFMASPEKMLRVWGVTTYMPHLAKEESLLAAQGNVQAMIGGLRSGFPDHSTLEARLAMNMDAALRRKNSGSILEIQASIKDTPVAFTADPTMILARFYQSNRAMSSRDMLLSFLESGVVRAFSPQLDKLTGVVKPVEVISREAGYVPLLQQGAHAIDKFLLEDDLILGSLDAWMKAFQGSGMTRQQLYKALLERGAQLEKPGAKVGGFATWANEIPEIQQLRLVRESLVSIRAKNFLEGVELYNPLQRVADISERMRKLSSRAPKPLSLDEIADLKKTTEGMDELTAHREALKNIGKQFDDLRAELDGIADEMNQMSGTKHKITGRYLETFYAQDQNAWRLYVPETVAQSLSEMFVVTESGPIKRFFNKVNAFYKPRLTVLAIAFSARNYVSNNLSNILDLGPFGALNPKTNFLAGKLTSGLKFYEEFGSLERARAVLGAPRGVNESKMAYKARQLRFARFKSSWDDILENGIDIGFGPEKIDDVYGQMKQHNVVSETFTQFVDMDRVEREFLNVVRNASDPSLWDTKPLKWIPKTKGMEARLAGSKTTWRQASSAVEDGFIVMAPVFFMGAFPLVVSLPKKWGAAFARSVENQGRVTNFLANYRKTGSWTDAAAHVNKFLFDYNDLTAFQRKWMRTIFPFWTWNQKNIALQMEMAAKKPVFYSQFDRFFHDVLPMELSDWDEEGLIRPEDPRSPKARRRRSTHALSKLRVPFPGRKDLYIEGMGLPQEAFVQFLEPMMTALDPKNFALKQELGLKGGEINRMFAQQHVLLKLAAETFSGKSSYYNRPIGELRDGRLFFEMHNTLKGMGVLGQMMGDTLKDVSGLTLVQRYSPRDGGTVKNIPQVRGMANHVFQYIPYSRLFRDASALNSAYTLAMNSDVMDEIAMGEVPQGYKPLEMWQRVLDAYTGIRLVQDDPDLSERLKEWEDQQLIEQYWIQNGVLREYGSKYVPRMKAPGE